jgi:hypothetical protein
MIFEKLAELEDHGLMTAGFILRLVNAATFQFSWAVLVIIQLVGRYLSCVHLWWSKRVSRKSESTFSSGIDSRQVFSVQNERRYA